MNRLARDSQLPFLVTDGEGGRRKTVSSLRTTCARYWRSMPRLLRTLLTIALVVAIVFVGSTLTSSSPSVVGPISADIEAQAHINNGNEIVQQKVEAAAEEELRAKEGAVVEEPEVMEQEKEKGPNEVKKEGGVPVFKERSAAGGRGRSFSDWFDTGLTIVDSIDTAIIMGLKDEVDEATVWIRDSLSFEKDRYVNFFEATIRVLGGLLSAFHLTGDTMFRDRAADVGHRLAGAFQAGRPVPMSDVNLRTRAAKSPSWSDESSLSEVTTVQLEFRDLSRITGDKTFEDLAFNTSKHIHEIGCARHGGLCEMYVNAKTGQFKAGTTITFGARADSYYEYLLKQYLQTGKTVEWLLADYAQSMASMEKLLLKESEPHKHRFVGELIGGDAFSPKMDHLVCFLSGTLVLGKLYAGQPEEHLQIAKDLGATCQEMYKTATGLAPEIAHFNMDAAKADDVIIKPLDSHCLLRPEAVEAWFYLYRATGDKKYQEWGWAAFEAIDKYARIAGGGYSSVNNVKTTKVQYRDLMESFLLAETFKYIYLLLADDQSELPLDRWVFNTEGHPLPIRTH
ncbi:mans-3 [Pristionchus pacificus]|uniref:alpha-1,2-Mannosidase n=1 Tax=Pristionchus pacificus TaxID=54126 RepID=A0A2A6B4N9_PRIPA|nr:mans-3 [Pristionchus pacificus]|eukprot:PDM60846.1 mans-3 [Pristionchus pacificus]